MSGRIYPMVRFILLGILVGAPLATQGQPQKAQRIGWLLAVPSTSVPTIEAVAEFRQKLSRLGRVEGSNLQVDYRYANGGPQELPALAAELVALKVDVIVTDGSPSTRAAQQATTTIPIVMAVSAAPVEQGFVKSLGRPGGNITGLSMVLPELAMKRLELIKELSPKAKRVAVLGRGQVSGSDLQWQSTEAAANTLSLELIRLQLDFGTPDYERLLDTARREKADALILLADSLFARDRAQIIALANKQRLPTLYFERLFVEAGGLMSYGPSIGEMFRQAAVYVDKILDGAKPAELPVEQPTKFELFLNVEAASALGITFQPSLRSRADVLQ